MADDHLISSDPKKRPAAPDRVWDYIHYPSWREALWTLLGEVLDDRVKREFKRRPPKYVVSDDLSWLDTIINRVTGEETDIKAFTAARLLERFDFIRACHATRTADVSAYYRHGLLPLDPSLVHARAAEIFLAGDFPELNAAHLDAAITDVGSDLRAGRVWFEANERDLVEHCGHYLLYGGEYLIALAAHLPRGRDYRQALKAFGRPTMFVCDIPLDMMGWPTLMEFAGCALESLFENLLDADYAPDLHRGAGFCVHRALGPEYIVGHYHLAKVRDPLQGFRVTA